MVRNDLHDLVLVWHNVPYILLHKAFVVIGIPLLSQADLSARCQWRYEAMEEIMCDRFPHANTSFLSFTHLAVKH